MTSNNKSNLRFTTIDIDTDASAYTKIDTAIDTATATDTDTDTDTATDIDTDANTYTAIDTAIDTATATAAAPEWTFEKINFVAGRRGADFYNKLDKLNVQAGEKDKILLAYVQHICEAHDTVMRSYYQQIQGSSRADAATSMENIGEQVYVKTTHNLFVISC